MRRAETPAPATGGDDLHRRPASEVYAALATGPRGLAADEAAARLRLYGPNALQTVKGKPLLLTFLQNFTHLMAWLLWVGGAIGFVAGMPELGLAIWAVNLINGLFSFWQEYRAERAAAALRALLPAMARVLRDGAVGEIPRDELVPGDVLLLAEGDQVGADGRLVEAHELRVDQSTLTGESRPVAKDSEAYAAPPEGAALPNVVFAGTSVVAGTGKAVVFATGMRSAFGTIAQLTQSVGDTPSPLQRELATVTRVVTAIAVGVGALFFALSVGLAGVSPAESFIFAMGMIVAFVPEGLLPTVTLALAIGVQRMARRNALVKRLSAVETLGCTQVICTDKTGTLTQNAMTVRHLWAGGAAYEVTGGGYAPEGVITAGGNHVARPPDDLLLLLRAASLCNDARLLPPGSVPPGHGDGVSWSILGDPTEAALQVAACKAGLDPAAEAAASPRVFEVPFESRRKLMSTLHRAGAALLYTKGAPNEVLARCAAARVGGRVVPLDDALRAEVLAAKDGYARGGLRVLGVAMRELPAGAPAAGEADELERDLVFLGLAAMFDPPRPEVEAAVAKCGAAGIRIIMITGDDGLTAESIARRLGIVRGVSPRLVGGVELEAMDDAALDAAMGGEVIFARAAPEQKLRIVTALQRLGNVVAVTGDGVNDAPALKQADIGVAMGLSGTDVARESADMILTDDNFATIVHAVEEGRGVYANIRKFATYIFTSNVPEAVPFVLFALSGGRIPLALTVMQILAIDLGTDMLPALALGAEPAEPGVMERPPRRRDDHIVSRGLLLRALGFLGLVQGAVAMLAFYVTYWSNGYAGRWLDLPGEGQLYLTATTMTLAAIVATQVGNLFAQRSERISIVRINLFSNRLIWVGIAAELALIVALVYLPPLQWVFGTAPLPAASWLFLLACTPALLLADEARKAVVRAREARRRAAPPAAPGRLHSTTR
jgi:Ca2+-transporting ATPase